MNFRVKIPEFKFKVPMPKPETEAQKLQKEMNELSTRYQKHIILRRKKIFPRIRIGRHLRNINPLSVVMITVTLILFLFIAPQIIDILSMSSTPPTTPITSSLIQMNNVLNILLMAVILLIPLGIFYTLISEDNRGAFFE